VFSKGGKKLLNEEELLDDEMVEIDPTTWILERDLRKAASELGVQEVRYLITTYYDLQEWRKKEASQFRAQVERGMPGAISLWMVNRASILEGQLKAAIELWVKNQAGVTGWAYSQVGVGPIVAAGLSAHIDIEKAPTVGHIWSFAGLSPESVWGKGERRPWNARLRTLMWLLGESIVKTSNRPESWYGPLFKQRKAYEMEKNERGEYAEQAAALLGRVPNHAQKAIYVQGKLSPGHLHSRAKRWTVKLFLSGWHEVAWFCQYGKLPPMPYPIDKIPGHTHYLPVPNAEYIPGLVEAEAEHRKSFGL
jgi:hypothetical protein